MIAISVLAVEHGCKEYLDHAQNVIQVYQKRTTEEMNRISLEI
jgi:hypothetical protein